MAEYNELTFNIAKTKMMVNFMAGMQIVNKNLHW